MITIRPSDSADDVAAVRELLLEYAAALPVDLSFQDFQTEITTLPGAYAPPAGALLLAEQSGKVVGCVALRPLVPPVIAELKRLYVRPEARGDGTGLALTDAVIDEARRAGYLQIRLDTLPSMRQAQNLYRALGFVEIPPYRHNPVPGTVFMELDLRY